MHLLEDTSQPQHVRNEQHLDSFWDGGPNTSWRSPIEDYGSAHVRALNYQHGMLDWRSDGFKKLEDFWNRHLYNGSAAALNAAESGGASTLGLAEWCNGNFIGARHTYAEFFAPGSINYYPHPALADTTQPNLQAGNLWGTAVHGDVTLENFKHGTRLYISKTNAGVNVTYHSALGYLIAQHPGKASGIPTLLIDDNNVLSNYHALLIPEAVEYSAGLLDYFFRSTLGVTVSNISSSTCGISIQNTSGTGEDFKGGSFRLFYDTTNGTRAELTNPGFSTNYAGALAPGGSVSGTFQIPNDAANYLLVYQGTVGTNAGQFSDPVDANIAIAARNFTLGPPGCPTVVTNIPSLPSTIMGGIWTYTSASFVVPPPGGTVAISIDWWSGSVIAGELDIIEGVGEFEVVGGNGYTITYKNTGLASNAQAGTVVPAGTQISYREDLWPYKAVYVPSVNRIFVNAGYDTFLVINPDTQMVESDFHVSNLLGYNGYDDYYNVVYAADVDRLYILSSLGDVYVINPHTQKVVTVIFWPAGGVGIYGMYADDGFYDPVNHRVGFRYDNSYTAAGLLLIKTSDNSIAADIAGPESDNDSAAEYSAVDDRLYVAYAGNIQVYSAADFSPVTTIPGSVGTIYQLAYSPVAAEIYGFGSEGAFYIDPIGSSSDTTTQNFTAPAIGTAVTVYVHSTSGMVAGKAIKINGVVWNIASVDSGTQFKASNLTVTSGTVNPAGVTVSWGGPRYFALPELSGHNSVNALFYSANNQKVIFTGWSSIDYNFDTRVFDPITKTTECIISQSQTPSSSLNIGCDGPDGNLYIPYWGNQSDSWVGGVYVLH